MYFGTFSAVCSEQFIVYALQSSLCGLTKELTQRHVTGLSVAFVLLEKHICVILYSLTKFWTEGNYCCMRRSVWTRLHLSELLL